MGLLRHEVKATVSGIEPMSKMTSSFQGVVNYVGPPTNPPDLHTKCIEAIRETFEKVFQCEMPPFNATQNLAFTS